jgi:hypothetical protein
MDADFLSSDHVACVWQELGDLCPPGSRMAETGNAAAIGARAERRPTNGAYPIPIRLIPIIRL